MITTLPDHSHPTMDAQTSPLATATAALRTGHLTEAETICRQLLAEAPQHPDAWHFLGLALFRQGHKEAAVAALSVAIALLPDMPSFYSNLGIMLRDLHRYNEAAQCFCQAARLQPWHLPHWEAAGALLLHLARPAEAIPAVQRVLSGQPERAELWLRLGVAQLQANDPLAARTALLQALVLDPALAMAHTHLADVFARLRLGEDAFDHNRWAVALDPTLVAAHNNLGLALMAHNRLHAACIHYAEALRLRPDYPEAHIGLGTAQLMQGKWAEGWKHYAWRWKIAGWPTQPRQFAQPAWNGTDLTGRVILLYAEQGLSDTIQFARYAPLVKRRGAGKVIVEAPASAVPLLQTLDGVEAVVARGAALPSFDTHAAFLDLPRLFASTLDTLPASIPYLLTDPARRLAWRKRLDDGRPGKKIGLVWAGNPGHSQDHRRSIPFALVQPLLTIPGIAWYGLQTDIRANDPAVHHVTHLMPDLSDGLGDLADTAALLAELDQVVSVDTAVAHVAGATNRPAWVMLPYNPDWRWMLDRDDSPWYPSLRLFRQSRPDRWEGVIGQIALALNRLIASED